MSTKKSDRNRNWNLLMFDGIQGTSLDYNPITIRKKQQKLQKEKALREWFLPSDNNHPTVIPSHSSAPTPLNHVSSMIPQICLSNPLMTAFHSISPFHSFTSRILFPNYTLKPFLLSLINFSWRPTAVHQGDFQFKGLSTLQWIRCEGVKRCY